MPRRVKRANKPRVSTDGVYDDFVNSDIEFSDNDAESESEESNVQYKRIRIGSEFLSVDDEQFIEGNSDDDEFHGFSCDDLIATDNNLPQTGVEHEWIFTEKKSIKWRAGNVNKKDFKFEHSADTEDAEDENLSPLDYFMRYIPEEMFDAFVTFTNIYAEQQKTKKWYPTNKPEIKQFIGLQIYMGNLKLPRIELFYSKDLDLKMFRDTIPLYRFYLLRTNLHLIDVEKIPKDCTDKFVRVRPLMDAVRKRCLELPVEEFLSVDEQMIPMRGRVTKGVKQYVKNKPKIKWGIKNLVLCGKSGLAYDFICYQGSTTEFDPKMLSTFGSGATMVLHLANRIDKSGHKLFFDNFFSTFQLFQVLAQKEIYAAGTVRLDRFAKPPFTSAAEMKKKGRGSSEQKVSADGSVVCVKWFDNKCVALASNYVGIGVTDKAHRFDKGSQQKLAIERPQIVREYNINMGGVDLMNQMISYYRISIRSKKWTLHSGSGNNGFACVSDETGKPAIRPTYERQENYSPYA
ncbi:piggyBac transposable element-derived protein 3-like [Bradysia coprophila]|uniref:piggyBac transposable element-derived protein 3-like n=1 Tax=Bradysia coprophila TaxID=38358 RepID=UPI00187D7EDC|nr:piggyBac transposable element-derived protein 3-like [Bradysia coprophila]